MSTVHTDTYSRTFTDDESRSNPTICKSVLCGRCVLPHLWNLMCSGNLALGLALACWDGQGGNSALGWTGRQGFKAVQVWPVAFRHNYIDPSSSTHDSCLYVYLSLPLPTLKWTSTKLSIHTLGSVISQHVWLDIPKTNCAHSMSLTSSISVRAAEGTIALQTTKLNMSEPSLSPSCLWHWMTVFQSYHLASGKLLCLPQGPVYLCPQRMPAGAITLCCGHDIPCQLTQPPRNPHSNDLMALRHSSKVKTHTCWWERLADTSPLQCLKTMVTSYWHSIQWEICFRYKDAFTHI